MLLKARKQCVLPVSYTHLDVYKRQDLDIISEYDLTVIFGNLLDNAIEAQEHVEDKRIIVEIREDKDFYYIRIKNHYDPARIIKTNEVFKTSKELSLIHILLGKNWSAMSPKELQH